MRDLAYGLRTLRRCRWSGRMSSSRSSRATLAACIAVLATAAAATYLPNRRVASVDTATALRVE